MSLIQTLESTIKMESYFSVSCPSLPFFVTEKLFMEDMEDVLSNTQPHSPLQWLRLVQQHDPNEDYVVTGVYHYKEQHLMPNFQHEYIILFIEPQLPSDTLGPVIPTILRASRTINNHTLWAQIGLWGPADDTVAVEGPANQFHPGNDKLLHRLLFKHSMAPSLRVISNIIYHVRVLMPRHHLIQHSCYSFALAVRKAIDLVYNGAQYQHDAIIRESHLLRFIPTPTTHALKTAWGIACFHWVNDGRQDGNVEV